MIRGGALSAAGGGGGAREAPRPPPPAAAAAAAAFSSLSPHAPPFTFARPTTSSSPNPSPAPTRRLSPASAGGGGGGGARGPSPSSAVIGAEPFEYPHRHPSASALGSVDGAFDSFGACDRRGGGVRIGPSPTSQKGAMAVGVDSYGARHDKNVDSITRNVNSGSGSSVWRHHVQPMRPNFQMGSSEWPDSDISPTYGQSVTFPYDTSVPEFTPNRLHKESSYSCSQLPTTNYVEDYYYNPSATYSTSRQLLTPSPTRTSFSTAHEVGNVGYSTVNSIADKAQQTVRKDHRSDGGKVARNENIAAEKGTFDNGSSTGENLAHGNLVDCANGSVLKIKHLDIPNASTFAIDPTIKSDDSMQNFSELDSPCWRGNLASKLSAYKAGETSTHFAITDPENFNNFDPEQIKTFRSVEYSESPAEQNGSLISNDSKKKFSASPMESSFVVSSNIQKKSANSSKIRSECVEDSHGKGIQCANNNTTRITEDKKRFADVKDNEVTQSGAKFSGVALNHFVSANGNSYTEEGRCSSSEKIIHVVVETMHSQSEMLLNTMGDSNNEMAEQDRNILRLIIENLETLLDKNRKNTGPKLDIEKRRNFRDIHGAEGQTSDNSSEAGKVYNFSNSQRDYVLNQAFEGFRKRTSIEEEGHPHVLLYKNLWINAEIAMCQLKYELQNARMEFEMETSKDHTGCSAAG